MYILSWNNMVAIIKQNMCQPIVSSLVCFYYIINICKNISVPAWIKQISQQNHGFVLSESLYYNYKQHW